MYRIASGDGIRRRLEWALAAVVLLVLNVRGAIQLVPESEQHVFDGSNRIIEVRWTNAGIKTASARIDAQLFAASSATVAPVFTIGWKRLELLPGQTIIEHLELNLPAVKGATHFLLQWLENTNKILGVTTLLAYPHNLLKELEKFAIDSPIAVFDPGDELKSPLRALGIQFIDLSERDLNRFAGKLLLIWPSHTTNTANHLSKEAVFKVAHRGASVLYFRASDSGDSLTPDFYAVPAGESRVLVAQQWMVSDLGHSPLSQFRLVRLAEIAAGSAPFKCLANNDFVP